METRSFKVLLVSPEPSLLRQVSKFLSVLGYQTRQARSVEQAFAACQAERPDFLLVDARLEDRGAFRLSRAIATDAVGGHVHTFLLVNDPTTSEIGDALEAGVDDFLARPIVYGELLARLRMGARVWEYHCRLDEQREMDSETGLLAHGALADRMERELNAAESQQVACAVLGVDFFGRVARCFGDAARKSALREFADRVLASCHARQVASRFKDDFIGVLLPGMSEGQAAAWAKEMQAKIVAEPLVLGDASLTWTVSVGVAACASHELSANELLSRAHQALLDAKESGGNCVVRDGEFESETQAWGDAAASRKLFERTVARDVMTPGEPPPELEGISDRAPFEEETCFTELMEFFIRDASSAVTIASSGQTTGYLTRDALVALSQPLDTGTFAPRSSYSSSVEYLRVSDAPIANEALA